MRYLKVEEILLIHKYVVQRYGGSQGLQSIELLESAVFRPKTSFGGKELYKTCFDKGACLIHSLISNHPFVDGNKRTAMVAGIVFLSLNGYVTDFSQEEVVEIALDIAKRNIELKELTKIMKRKSRT